MRHDLNGRQSPERASQRGNRPTRGWESLTPRELEVARLAADGLTNPEIAERVFISRATVKVHLSHIYAKLGLRNRSELAVKAALRQTADLELQAPKDRPTG
jgi:DNA-binding CsgD family transcriptional regulator